MTTRTLTTTQEYALDRAVSSGDASRLSVAVDHLSLTSRLEVARQTINQLTQLAITGAESMDEPEISVHELESRARSSLGYYYAAEAVLRRHGPLFEEFVDSCEFVRLRRLARMFSGL